MKKPIHILTAAAAISVCVFSLFGCGGKVHTHELCEWKADATGHWRVCIKPGCPNKVQTYERGEHDGVPCSVCGPQVKVIAFYTGINDQAHVSFVHEANAWFTEQSEKYQFTYTSTNDWTKLNADVLAEHDLVMFLDTRPEDEGQRDAFKAYMQNGGAFIGFHFSAFALKNSAYDTNWDWYHNEFLGSGEYLSNTWAPTTAKLLVETHDHPATADLPDTFEASACEWYRWQNDITLDPDITVLASIHPDSFPLGTGPKPEEIWHEGYYPVVWTNNKYHMVYMNMGHNLVDYGEPCLDLSKTFDNEIQNKLIINSIFGLTRY